MSGHYVLRLVLTLSRCVPGAEEVPREHAGESLRRHLRQGASGEGGNPGGGECLHACSSLALSLFLVIP